MKDKAQKRREYLLAQAGTGTVGCVGVGLTVIFGLLTAISLVSVIGTAAWCFQPGPDGAFPAIAAFVVCLLMLVFFASITFFCIWMVSVAADDSRSRAYVPPVREQIAALPAEEVLLRGADQPVAATEDLVRPVQAVMETDADELLRSVEGGTT